MNDLYEQRRIIKQKIIKMENSGVINVESLKYLKGVKRGLDMAIKVVKQNI
jgi:hypothetical protein